MNRMGTLLTILVGVSLFLIDGSELLSIVEKIETRMANFGPATTAVDRDSSSISPLHAWTQIDSTVGGNIIVRAIMPEGATCPIINIAHNGKTHPARMQRRLPKSSRRFPNALCEYRQLPATATARLPGWKYEGSDSAFDSIVVIGDTGCRMTWYNRQPCRDKEEWPFARIAKLAARRNPDLVLHVGDYHYREAACPDSELACEGSPWGDVWEVWRDDFFEPAQPLLNAAPLIALRGNHENCSRGGAGWFHFLDVVEARRNECEPAAAPYFIDLGHALSILALDTGSRRDRLNSEGQVDALRNWCKNFGKVSYQLREELRPKKDHKLVLVAMHQPAVNVWNHLWESDSVVRTGAGELVDFCSSHAGQVGGEPNPHPKIFDAHVAIRRYVTEMAEEGFSISMVSGDTHEFEYIGIRSRASDTHFSQLVVGNGGTALEESRLFVAAGTKVERRRPLSDDCAWSFGIPERSCQHQGPGNPPVCLRASWDASEEKTSTVETPRPGTKRCAALLPVEDDDTARMEKNDQAWAFSYALSLSFGYMHLEHAPRFGWIGRVFDQYDRIAAVCAFPTGSPSVTLAEAAKGAGWEISVELEGQGCVTCRAGSCSRRSRRYHSS